MENLKHLKILLKHVLFALLLLNDAKQTGEQPVPASRAAEDGGATYQRLVAPAPGLA
jgi:hypothetical protein